ncbi:MAG: PIN domain-containing protein [Candidatus Nanoarchaeia archaeon]|nr:PIN domain-containing protein [Candidatus Nanoarchaeia archaeon]MDD5587650.1 PIN domain-containing protein [Candidatus Nanoarchaeia archaeon]
MGNIKVFFFDTYALYELIEGNPNYKPYTKNIGIITTKLNLMELHYGLFLKYGKEIADNYYDKLIDYTIQINDNIIKKANEFRVSFKKRKLSYVDCIGYIIARSRNVKFLTGDKEFEDLEGVEFVK